MNNIVREKDIIVNILKEKEIVSFDIFDTLVLRDVIEPTDIFKLISIEYKRKFNKKLDIDFYELRQKCERKSREKNYSKEDINLNEIYDEVSEKIGRELSEKLKNIELELEEKFIVENNFMKEIYKFCLKEKKEIYIISDMYLEKSFLEKILKNLGYLDYSNLYVSSEIRKTKASGSIYEYVKQKENLDPKKWIHIGDNYISDVKNAEKNGLEGYYYKKVSERAKINKLYEDVSDSILKALEINEINTKSLEYWEKFGIKYASKIYYGIVNWLSDNLLKSNEKNIYFMARDGYIIKKIYEKFYSNSKIESRYLYTSRRAFQYAELYNKNFEELFDILVAYNPQYDQKLTIKECLLNLELNLEECEKKLDESLKLDTVVNHENREEIKKYFKKLEKEIRNKLEKEKENLIDYLRQEDIYNKKLVNIFDIGWRGSIQKALMDFVETKIQGYYFGTTAFLHEKIKNTSKGFAFDKGKPEKECNLILKNLMIYELIFSAPEGSLINFYKNELSGKIYPNLKEVEGNKEILLAISKLQKAAIEFLEKLKKYENYIEISPEKSVEDLNEMLEKKEFEDLYEFSKLSNAVGFGNSEDKKLYVSSYFINEYLSDREKIKNDIQKNLWPGAVLLLDENNRIFTEKEVEKIYFNNENYIYIETKVEKVPLLCKMRVKKGIRYLKNEGLLAFIKKTKNVIEYNLKN